MSLTSPFVAGARRSTVEHLLIWSNALTHDGVLPPESYREMLTSSIIVSS